MAEEEQEKRSHPFTLKETEAYLNWRGLMLDRYDITQAYMLTGGVAYYLSYFKAGRSLAQNVDELFFSSDGFLQKEYDRLFTSLFADNAGYRRIVEVLAGNRFGLTREVIAQKTEISLGGSLSRLRNKLQTLLTATGKRNVQVSLVTTFGLKMNMYSSRVQRVVTLDDLFSI